MEQKTPVLEHRGFCVSHGHFHLFAYWYYIICVFCLQYTQYTFSNQVKLLLLVWVQENPGKP